MKKATLIILCLLLPLAASAAAVKALLGIHASKYLFPGEITNLNHRQKTGLGFGVGYALAINPKMELEANLLYSQKGAKTTLDYGSPQPIVGTYSNTIISLPVFFKYKLREGSTPYAALGPEFNFVLDHELQIPEYKKPFDLSAETKKFVLGIHMALGYEIPLGQWGFFAELRYNRWLSSLLKSPDSSIHGESLSFMVGGIYFL